jgi:hypothetical protein
MKDQSTRRSETAFTQTDLVVLLAAIVVLAVVAYVPITTVRDKAGLSTCTGNLQQISRAILRYAEDNQKRLPLAQSAQESDIWWWYKEQVKGYLGLTGPSSMKDKVFACPADRGYSDPTPFHLNGKFDYSSYVFNGVTLPGAPNISGWLVPSVNRPQQTLLVMEWCAHAPLSWHKSRTGRKNQPFYNDAMSVVGFVDGHVSFSKIYYDGYNAAYMRDPIPGYQYKYSGN